MPSPLEINLSAFSTIPSTVDVTKPIYMLNLWKYKETAKYLPEHAQHAGEPCTGREASMRYRTTIRPLLPPNASYLLLSTVLTHVVAPKDEVWDDAFVVRYESLEGFRKMVESKEYVEQAQPHRLAALEDMRLIMLDKIEP